MSLEDAFVTQSAHCSYRSENAAKPSTSGRRTIQEQALFAFRQRHFVGPPHNNMIHDTKFFQLIGGHEMVAVEGFFDRVVVLAGMPDVDIIQPPLDLHDVFGVTQQYRRPGPGSRRTADAS